jgi:hypothetical protein
MQTTQKPLSFFVLYHYSGGWCGGQKAVQAGGGWLFNITLL